MLGRNKLYSVVAVIITILLFGANVCWAETSDDEIKRFSLRLPSVSLLPDDYSGFLMAVSSDQVDTNRLSSYKTSKDGKVCYLDLLEEEARIFFSDASPLSIGPDNSILWASQTDGLDRTVFVQHGNVIVPLIRAKNRGAKDIAGNLKKTWTEKESLLYSVCEGKIRWSPDGNYIFLNENIKWHGIKMKLDDPYLIDTTSGEVFLIETDNVEKTNFAYGFHYIYSGRFSDDGLYFDYDLASITADKDMPSYHILKRYNLSTGASTELYSTANIILDFCPVGNDRWFAIERADNAFYLVKLAKEDKRIVEEKKKIRRPDGAVLQLIPISEDSAVLFADFSRDTYSCFALLDWNESQDLNRWHIIQDVLKNKIDEVSVEEIEKLFYEAYDISNDPKLLFQKSDIKSISSVYSYPYLLIMLDLNREVTESWNNMVERLHCYAAVNLETMEVRPVIIDDNEIPNIMDEVLYQDPILLGNEDNNVAFVISNSDFQRDTSYDIKQDSENLIAGDVYTCNNGTYQCLEENASTVLTPYGVETSNVKMEVYISGKKEVYQLLFSFIPVKEEDRNEYIIPYAISIERFKAFTDMMSRKNQKQTYSCYQLYTPEKARSSVDAENLLDKYPNLANVEMYVLKSVDNSKMEKIEEYFRETGYTYDDYLIDSKNISPEYSLLSTTHFPVCYVFTNDLQEDMLRTEALELASYCDRVCSKAYKELYYVPEAKSDKANIENSIVSDILQARTKNDIDSIMDSILENIKINGIEYDVEIKGMEKNEQSFEIQLELTISD